VCHTHPAVVLPTLISSGLNFVTVSDDDATSPVVARHKVMTLVYWSLVFSFNVPWWKVQWCKALCAPSLENSWCSLIQGFWQFSNTWILDMGYVCSLASANTRQEESVLQVMAEERMFYLKISYNFPSPLVVDFKCGWISICIQFFRVIFPVTGFLHPWLLIWVQSK
jgi:hypothetical protein